MKGDARKGTWVANGVERSGSVLPFVRRHGARVRTVIILYCLLGLILLSIREVRQAAVPGQYATDIEEVDTDFSGAMRQLVITAIDKESGYRAILADDPAMWYGRSALTHDASRLVFVGARFGSGGHLTDSGLYVAEVTRGRLGRPQKAGPAVRAVAFSDIPIFGIIPIWLEDGSRVLYQAPVENKASELTIYHIFLADLRAGRVHDLTPPSLGRASNPDYSEQSGMVAFTGTTIENGEKRWDVYTIRPDGTGLRRLTQPGNTKDVQNVLPKWTKDGQAVQYSGGDSVYRIAADGTGRPHPLYPLYRGARQAGAR